MNTSSPTASAAKRRLFSLIPVMSLLGAVFNAKAESGQGTTPPSDQAQGEKALAALTALLNAYSEGQVSVARALLSSQMTGYERIIEALHDAVSTKKQFVISLSDTSTFASTDVVIIRTQWEKRFLTLPALAPRRSTGQSSFVMRQGVHSWILFAWGGDNLFAAR